MKNLKKVTLVALAMSALVLAGCSTTPWPNPNDQVNIAVDRKANGDTRTECTGQGRGVSECPNQDILDINTSNHSSRYDAGAVEAKATAQACQKYPTHPKCRQ